MADRTDYFFMAHAGSVKPTSGFIDENEPLIVLQQFSLENAEEAAKAQANGNEKPIQDQNQGTVLFTEAGLYDLKD